MKSIIYLILRAIGCTVLSLLFLANPVLCALCFALDWGIIYGIIFAIVSFIEVGFMVMCMLAFTDDYDRGLY